MLDFILVNSAKNNVEPSQLQKELIDLGIPKESCIAIGKVHEKSIQKVRATLSEKMLRSKFSQLSNASECI